MPACTATGSRRAATRRRRSPRRSPSGSTTTRSPTRSTRRLAGRRPVAIMGGHDIERRDPRYATVARIARTLAREGFLMVSGGGPGAMEATHLGVWMAHFDDHQLDAAIDVSCRPRPDGAPAGKEFADADWLHRAFAVRGRWPVVDCATSRSASPRGRTATSHRPRSRRRSPSTSPTASARTACSRSPRTAWCSRPARRARSRRSSRTPRRTTTRCSAQPAPMVLFGVDYWTERYPVWSVLQALSADRPYSAADHAHRRRGRGDHADRARRRRTAAHRLIDRRRPTRTTGIEARATIQPTDGGAAWSKNSAIGATNRIAAGEEQLHGHRPRAGSDSRAATAATPAASSSDTRRRSPSARARPSANVAPEAAASAGAVGDVVAGPPAARPPGSRGTRSSTTAPRPGRARRTRGTRPADRAAGRTTGGDREHLAAWRLRPERGGRQRVGAEVEGEDLQHAECQREPAAGDGPQQERCQLRRRCR